MGGCVFVVVLLTWLGVCDVGGWVCISGRGSGMRLGGSVAMCSCVRVFVWVYGEGGMKPGFLTWRKARMAFVVRNTDTLCMVRPVFACSYM